jgi:hypothetical protein
MKSKLLQNLKNKPQFCLFVVFCFCLLMFLSPIVAKSQSNSSNGCKMDWIWNYEYESGYEIEYNPATGRTESVFGQRLKHGYRYRCVPQSTSSDGLPTYPNVVRDSKGDLLPASGYRWATKDPENFTVERIPNSKLSPADGYRWVNTNDPKDFRVELIPKSGNDGSRLNSSTETNSPNLAGSWEGTYLCGQGLTNLNLLISQNNSSEITAIFDFHANRSNPSVASGSYWMKGTYNSKTQEIVLKATEWISQPSGYVAVNLSGRVSDGNTKISGKMESPDCSTFSLEKKWSR